MPLNLRDLAAYKPTPSLHPDRRSPQYEAETLLDQALGFWLLHGSHIANAAIVLSAIAALLLIVSGRANAKRANTLSFIIKSETDGDIIEARKQFIQVIYGNHRSSYYSSPKLETEDKAEAADYEVKKNAIRTILNLHELAAVSIQEGALDERVFRRWYNGGFIRDFDKTSDYIVQLRENYGNHKVFQEFEYLSREWKADKDFNPKPGLIRRKWLALRRVWRA